MFQSVFKACVVLVTLNQSTDLLNVTSNVHPELSFVAWSLEPAAQNTLKEVSP